MFCPLIHLLVTGFLVLRAENPEISSPTSHASPNPNSPTADATVMPTMLVSADFNLPILSWMHIQKTSGWIGAYLLKKYCINNSTHTLPGVGRRQLRHDTTGRSKRNKKRQNHQLVKQHEGVEHSCAVNLLPEIAFGYHFPNNGKLLQRGTILTMFRNPLDRLISAYLFDPKGGMLPMGYPHRGIDEAAIHSYINNATVPIVAYATLSAIPSCQTKMMLGYACGEDLQRQLTVDDEAEAKRRLHEDILVFGLTEDYQASFALFDATLADYLQLAPELTHPVQTTTKRIRKNAQNDAVTNSRLRFQLEDNGWSDLPDEALYKEAGVLFCERCEAYNITTTIDCKLLKASY